MCSMLKGEREGNVSVFWSAEIEAVVVAFRLNFW